MGSYSMAPFLTKLLRQDKKEKPKQPVDKKRRHSAPVPDWYEITEAGQITVNAQKLPEKSRKQNMKYASQQNLSGTKKQKQTRPKQANDKSKRQSAGFPSWFCVSGNTETLDRSLMPLSDHENNKDNMSNNKKITVNNDKPKVDFIRLKGTNGRAKENRYSAPPVEWASKKATSSNGQCEMNKKVSKPVVKQVRRELSPGVKYRTDGTLEKPYVFPAGLTFGPEGRKLQLRRTAYSYISEEPTRLPRPNEKTVRVDVHRSSTEDIIMEYSYEDINPDLGEFDVRKAFYLKYDSDFSETKTHENSVDCDNYKQSAFNYNTDHSYIYRRNTNGWENGTNSPKINETIVGAGSRIAHQKNSKQKEMCRYSMPEQNDDLVYMGSFENVSEYTLNENDVPKPSVNVGDNTRRSSRSSARCSRRNRYSMPVRNSDLVYMGSFENVNQLLNGNTNAGTGFSLYSEANDTDERSQHSGGERCRTFSEVHVDQSENFTAAVDEKHGSVLSGYKYHRRCGSSGGAPALVSPVVSEVNLTTSSVSLKNISIPCMQSAKNVNISKRNSEKDVSSTSGDEDRDVFDASSLSCDTTDKTAFFTRRGRSSCMPGNSRFIAPPPAVTVPFISTNSTNANSARSPFMPGSKLFSLPPPPNYTPPKEDMEFTHAQLKEMNCHKGSQTDLSIEFENLTMEDRDASLQREDVKTIYAGAPTHISGATFRHPTDRVKSNSFVLQDRTQKTKSVDLHGQMLDVSDVSHGSDEVFHDTQSSVCEENERSKTRRFTKFRSKISSNLDHNKLPISSSLSYNNEIDKKRLSGESKVTNRINQSEVSCASSSSASKTNFTSTPTRSLRPQSQSCESNIATPSSKPIPTPRKISHTDSLSKRSDISAGDTKQAFTYNSVQPVPKQRHSLAYSRSISPSNSYETMSSPNESQEGRRTNRQQLLRTQSCDQATTLQRKQNKVRSQVSQSDASQNIYVSIDGENVYEEIDSEVNVSDLNNSKYENIYEECGHIDSHNHGNTFEKNKKPIYNIGKNDKQRFETSLSPLQTIALSASPGQRRRNVNTQKEPATHSISLSQPQCNSGLPIPPVQPDALCAKMEREKGGTIELVAINKQFQYNDSDDNSSIADDEMSVSNEEDVEEVAKRYSLRRCVSADNLLRSGSIIDRSMILAKRRKQRMRDRRTKSQLQLFTDAKYDLTNTSFKVHYTKRKRTSKERLFKQKPNHTDSGHDSEIVSPCTSPDTRRHVDNITSLNHAGGCNDTFAAWVPRNGTLPRKSWEIRLKNTQNLRKCRSRESLLIPSEKMVVTSNSAFDTGY